MNDCTCCSNYKIKKLHLKSGIPSSIPGALQLSEAGVVVIRAVVVTGADLLINISHLRNYELLGNCELPNVVEE
jgi:hypothetical protein